MTDREYYSGLSPDEFRAIKPKVRVFEPTHREDWRITATTHPYYIEFRCLEVSAFGDEVWYTPAELEDDDEVLIVGTRHIAKAKVVLEGHIKWDGHSVWHFDREIETAGRADTARIGRLLDRLWDLAHELLGTLDEELAK